MSIWNRVTLSALYTLSPTHCGTGQAMGALDLPIARDTLTGFPVLPATSLKGVARDYLSNRADFKKDAINRLFGKSLEEAETDIEQLEAGAIAFTEGRLIAYPTRSLNRPFFHVTCPLIIERLERDFRALGLPGIFSKNLQMPSPDEGKVYVADADDAGQTLVLEDLVFPEKDVGSFSGLKVLAERLAGFLPESEIHTKNRLVKGLVMVSDEDFTYLMHQAPPVRARIKLTAGKTTTPWRDPETGEQQKGNLWYEESLPSDCLFLSFIGERRQRSAYTNESSKSWPYPEPPLKLFWTYSQKMAVVQMGGNETVGYGLCLWNVMEPNGSGKNEKNDNQ